MDPTKTPLYQIVVATLVLTPMAHWLLGGFPPLPSAVAVASALYQDVFVAGVTYGRWFSPLRPYRTAQVSGLTVASPAVGSVEGCDTHAESPGPKFISALFGVAAGIVRLSWPAGIAPLQAV